MTQPGRRLLWNFYPRPPRGGRPSAQNAARHPLQFLSTPSARRATGQQRFYLPSTSISIHALREEGDDVPFRVTARWFLFLSTPSARRATGCLPRILRGLRGFLSTPSARRATGKTERQPLCHLHFYPRPPRGGRPSNWLTCSWGIINFYPRPPRGGRPNTPPPWSSVVHFYPRPPRGGRPRPMVHRVCPALISIHALREEGDRKKMGGQILTGIFLSTPSARRATCAEIAPMGYRGISIHALREEGDLSIAEKPRPGLAFLSTPSARRATCRLRSWAVLSSNFYPRPPRGGRQYADNHPPCYNPISIHALREEGDLPAGEQAAAMGISIHALREEGDNRPSGGGKKVLKFLSTPSARRATV